MFGQFKSGCSRFKDGSVSNTSEAAPAIFPLLSIFCDRILINQSLRLAGQRKMPSLFYEKSSYFR